MFSSWDVRARPREGAARRWDAVAVIRVDSVAKLRAEDPATGEVRPAFDEAGATEGPSTEEAGLTEANTDPWFQAALTREVKACTDRWRCR